MAAKHVADQGKAASELGLPRTDCPYLDGENRDNWLEAYDAAEAKKAEQPASA